MDVFGLPRGLGLTGIIGDPRIWASLVTAVLLAVAFALLEPHALQDCEQCAARVARHTAIVSSSPIFAFPLALGITDPPVIALLCVALALAHRSRWAWAGCALAVACAMKTTAWAAVPVLAVLAWVRYTPRIAARFGVMAVGASGLLAALAAPEAMARPAAIMQNTVDFPLGLTRHKTPAQSPLPGHLLAGLGPAGHTAAVLLMVAAAIAFAAWLLLRPPRTALAAGWRLAIGYAIVFTLDPSSRFGYFIYPLGILGWLAMTTLYAERPGQSRPGRAPALPG
jgi:phosphatidylinositol alpha-1,6-mannosyltransferase